MKNLFKILGIFVCAGILAYAAYLVYLKFFSKTEENVFDDLEEEEERPVTFGERIKAAAERQLARIR